MKQLNIPCPICGYMNYDNCGCRYMDYIAHITELESNNIELEYEVHRLRKLTTPVYFNISNYVKRDI